MGEDVQINLRIDDEIKRNWLEYCEDSGKFTSLSGLIRYSVSRVVNGSGEGGISPELERDLAELTTHLEDDIDEISDQLDSLNNDVEWLREQKQGRHNISDLAQDVYDELKVLPEPPTELQVPSSWDGSRGEYIDHTAARIIIEPDDADESRNPQTISAIADRVDTDVDRVQDAIEHLQDQFLPVLSVAIDGRTHYFKEE